MSTLIFIEKRLWEKGGWILTNFWLIQHYSPNLFQLVMWSHTVTFYNFACNMSRLNYIMHDKSKLSVWRHNFNYIILCQISLHVAPWWSILGVFKFWGMNQSIWNGVAMMDFEIFQMEHEPDTNYEMTEKNSNKTRKRGKMIENGWVAIQVLGINLQMHKGIT